MLRLLPGRNTGRGGRPGDPLNLLFVGYEAALKAALRAAGWSLLPPTVLACVAGGALDLLRGRRLTRFPPMNDYRLLGRGAEQRWVSVLRPLHSRHHFRLWRAELCDEDGRPLWWGSANFDVELRWRDLSHRPDPDVDAEREHVAATLSGSPLVARTSYVALPQIPRAGINDKGYPFRGDGRALLVELVD